MTFGLGTFGSGTFGSVPASVVIEDYQVQIGTLLTGSSTNSYEFVELDGLEDLPDVRIFDKERALKHGLFSTRDLYGKRVLTYTVEVWGTSNAAFRANVDAIGTATSNPDTNVVWIGQLPSHPFGQWLVSGKVRKRSLPINENYLFTVGTVVMQLECADPRVYSATLHTLSSGVSTSTGGLSLPLSLPVDFGGTGTSGTMVVTNVGNFPTPWQAAITGPVTNPQIQNLDTGDLLRVEIAVALGDTLYLDSDLHLILLNGTSSRYGNLSSDSDWFDFNAGTTNLRFTGVTAGSPQCTVTWRDARI